MSEPVGQVSSSIVSVLIVPPELAEELPVPLALLELETELCEDDTLVRFEEGDEEEEKDTDDAEEAAVELCDVVEEVDEPLPVVVE